MLHTFMELIQNHYYAKCVMLYVGIIATSTIFAYLSQHDFKRMNDGRAGNHTRIAGIQKISFFLSFFVLWIFSAFASCGADRESYRIIFQGVSIGSIFDGWQEPGFNLFNLVFRVLGDNPRIIYIAMSTVTLGLIYRTLSYLKDEICIWAAVLAYGSLFYVQSLSLMRIYMAAAILFWGIRFLKRNEYFKYVIVLLCAILIHYSCCIMIFPWIILYMMYNHRYQLAVHITVILCAMAGGIVSLKVLAPALGSIPMFTRFQQYFENMQSGGFGIMQFVYFIPICLLVIWTYQEMNENYKRIFFTYTSCAFLIGITSYVLIILGRAFALFSILYLFITPYTLKAIKEREEKWKYYIICVLVVMYYIFRFVIYIAEYHELDQVVPYTNVLF